MNKIIELFKKNDLIKRNKPNHSIIDSLSLTKFIDFNKELEGLIISNHKPVMNPFFSYAADPNLGGSDIECREINCRFNRIDNLARYALLYSEEVYIESYFSKYAVLERLEGNVNYERVKRDFYNDLVLINHIIPLLEKGIIKIYSPNKKICFSCQAKNILGEKAGKLFNRASKKLLEEMKNNFTISFRQLKDNYAFRVIGSDKYFDHGIVLLNSKVPSTLKNHKNILKKIHEGKEVILSKTVAKEMRLDKDLAHTFMHNTIYGLSTSYCLNTSFLTRSEKQIEFINSLNYQSDLKENNIISQKHLSSIVPFIEDVDIKNLIKLRERESEAFINYRSALKESLIHYKNIKGKFTQTEAKEFYSDILEPQIASLELKVKQAKRDLINKPVRSLVGIVGVLSFGMLSGLFPENISQLAQIIGLTKFGSDLIKDTIKIGDKEKSVIDDKYYFLWKVKKLASK